MRIEIDRENLLIPVSVVAGVVERRQTLPILAYLLLRASETGISMIGTDLEVEVVAIANGEVVDRGDVTVPARKLLEICRALPEGVRITVASQGNKIAVKAGKSRFSLATLPADDFPKVETLDFVSVLTIPALELKRVLDSTAFCMAQQDVRYYLNGLYLEVENHQIRAVATDGHRMAIMELQGELSALKPAQIIVPRKAIHEIARLLPSDETPVTIAVDTNHLRLQVAGLVVTSKLIDGKFPDYRKVIPAVQTKSVILNQIQFRDALSRVAILANEKYRGVRLNLQSGKLSVTAHNPEQEEAIEEIETSYSGEPLEIGFNVNYLVEAAGAIDSPEIVLGLSDANSSCTLRSSVETGAQYIVMPMRL